MGCTSSAPNMVSSSTAEKSIQFEEEMSDDQSNVEEIIYRAERNSNEITKLPSSDTVAEHSADIVRNRSNNSLKNQTDAQEERFLGQVTNKSESSLLEEDDHPPKLEQVVEKVVELHSLESVHEIQPVAKSIVEDSPNKNDDSNSLKETHDIQDNGEENGPVLHEQKDEHPEEATSPSQSESSRATRWEALADIAAELPPSLTVDPITGQIYALSK
uniref:Uncharacterized protein n=1 Tax=Heliothis virescens TaxID=7102 RepID=A0A2A4JFT2_HELVI